jgi:hypothetical protein
MIILFYGEVVRQMLTCPTPECIAKIKGGSKVSTMRCITPAQVDNLFGSAGFSISLDHAWYRSALVLKEDQTRGESRIGGRPTVDPTQLALFALELNSWLPTASCRLLWIDHWNSDYPSVDQIVVAARLGLGEPRSLSAAPGHLFDPYPYHERDQVEISPDHAKEINVLVGLMSLIMIGGWDAWLVTNASASRVEFWEGNIFFHTRETTMLASAEGLLARFNCSRILK